MTLPPLPPAFRDAPCREEPRLWDGEKPEHIAEAIRVCKEACPLLAECARLHKGIRGLVGVIAGRPVDEATRLRAGRRTYGAPREHGTDRGYEQHKSRSEYSCQPCLDAHAEHVRLRREARKASA